MSWFDNYLARAQARKADNLSYTGTKPAMQAMGLEQQRMASDIDGAMMRGQSSEISEVLRQKAAGAYNQNSESLMANERNRVMTDNNNIDNAINEVIAKKEAEKEAKEKARKDGLLKTGLSVGGAALGAVVGSVVPGAGTMIGAQLGASLGGIAGGFVGGGGKMAVDQADPEVIMAGVQDTISGISAASTLKSHKKDAEDMLGFMNGYFREKDPAEKANKAETLRMISMAISAGNMQLARELIKEGWQ